MQIPAAKTRLIPVELDAAINDQVTNLQLRSAGRNPGSSSGAVKEFVAFQTAQLDAIGQGIRDADSGLLVAHDEVAA